MWQQYDQEYEQYLRDYADARKKMKEEVDAKRERAREKRLAHEERVKKVDSRAEEAEAEKRAALDVVVAQKERDRKAARAARLGRRKQGAKKVLQQDVVKEARLAELRYAFGKERERWVYNDVTAAKRIPNELFEKEPSSIDAIYRESRAIPKKLPKKDIVSWFVDEDNM